MFTIYRYTCANKRNYVGITMYPDVRRGQHRQKEFYYADTTKFAKAIQEFGYDNLAYEVIETVETLEQACEREIYWISFYDSLASGYNTMPGGMHAPVFVHGERVIEDIKYELKHTSKKLREIAKSFGVSIGWVSDIMNGNKRSNEKIVREPQFQKGSNVHNAKLSEATTKEIREKLETGTSRREIQALYKISKTLVQLIATNQIWTHVESEYEYKKKVLNGNAILNPEIVSKLKSDLRNGESAIKVAEKYKVSVATIYQIKQGRTWKFVP